MPVQSHLSARNEVAWVKLVRHRADRLALSSADTLASATERTIMTMPSDGYQTKKTFSRPRRFINTTPVQCQLTSDIAHRRNPENGSPTVASTSARHVHRHEQSGLPRPLKYVKLYSRHDREKPYHRWGIVLSPGTRPPRPDQARAEKTACPCSSADDISELERTPLKTQ